MVTELVGYWGGALDRVLALDFETFGLVYESMTRVSFRALAMQTQLHQVAAQGSGEELQKALKPILEIANGKKEGDDQAAFIAAFGGPVQKKSKRK